MARRLPTIKPLREQLTLTRLSIIIGMIASLVGIGAAFGLLGASEDDARPSNGDFRRASKPVADAVYSGETDQGNAMHFRVWLDGRTIRDLTVPLEGRCSDTGALITTYRQEGAAGFAITGGILSGSSDVSGRRGEIADGIFRLNARFGDSGRTVKGTVSIYVENVDGSTCDSPEVAFTAAAERA